MFAGAFFGGAFMKYKCPMRVSAFTIVGFALGAKLSYMASPNPSGYSMNFDPEITAAFEARYVRLQLNAAGYGNNALNNNSHTQNGRYQKAY